MNETITIEKQVWESTLHRSMVLQAENEQLKEYERIVTSYNMKPIDYDIACETVNKLLDEKKDLKHRNENLQLALKTYELPEIQKVLIDWRTGELDRKFNKLEKENAQLKEQINHLLKTQARQFVDNQKLQVKAEKAKDVVNIDTARQIKQLKELLKEWVQFEIEENPLDFTVMSERMSGLANKTKRILK